MSHETELMTQLMGRLRSEMNGAVVGAMEDRGLCYALNYGVALHTIRDVALQYTPNHNLAKLIYCQDVRELIIVALYIANPDCVTAGELGFWAAEVKTIELAEQFGGLLGRCGVAWKALDKWGSSERTLLTYSAMLGATKRVSTHPDSLSDLSKVIEYCTLAVNTNESYLWRGAVSLLERVYRHRPDSHQTIIEFKRRMEGSKNEGAIYFASELAWRIEY